MTNLSTNKLSDLRSRRLLARDALDRAGTLEFKPVTSAKWVNVEESRNGAIRVQIEHDTIRGVTPTMMRWWFENLAATTTWNGVDFTGPQISHYHLWHHRDHISVTPLSDGSDGRPNNGFAVGATSRIDEQFNDFHDRIHAKVRTTRLDEEEFNFDLLTLGQTVGHIEHKYHEERGGLRFYAETVIGLDGPASVANHLRKFAYTTQTAENWIRHNIEETGRSEQILPVLYRHAMAQQ
ncbi:hypothetical protein ACWEPH_02570 [Nocardia beijingensis]